MTQLKEKHLLKLIKNSAFNYEELKDFLKNPQKYEHVVSSVFKNRFLGISKIRVANAKERKNMKYVGMDELIKSLEQHDEEKLAIITFFKKTPFEYKNFKINSLSDISKLKEIHLSKQAAKDIFVLDIHYGIISQKFSLFTDKYYLKILGLILYDENHKVKTTPITMA